MSEQSSQPEPRQPIGRIGRAPLLARGNEVEQIRAGLLSARLGEPLVYLILGEAGIGKSRLLDEAAALAEGIAAGPAVFRGHSYDEAAMPPYLPWIELARGLHDTLPADLTARILGDYPEIHPLLPWLSETELRSRGDPDVERLRLFDGVTRAIERIAAERLVLLIFDDVQWMDTASAALLRYLATHLSRSQVLVLLAARDDELAANHAMNRAIEEANRQRLLVEIPVRRLNRAETGELVRHLIPGAGKDLADELYRESEGNPFYVEELAKSWTPDRSGRQTPRGISAIIRRSLSRLSPAARELLEWAAIAGRSFDVDLLVMLSRHEGAPVAELLDEALSLGLVKASGSRNQLEFAHDRIRQGLLEDLNVLKRRRLHLELAGAVEENPRFAGDQRAATLAYHFGEADEPKRAYRYAGETAAAAAAMHAYDEAARHLRYLVEHHRSRPSDTPTESPAELRMRLADVEVRANEVSKAIDHYEEAAAELVAAGRPEVAGKAYRLLGMARIRNEQPREALLAFRQSLALLPEESREEIALTLTYAASVHGLTLAEYEEGIRLGRRALEAAPEGNRQLGALARLTLAQTLSRAGELGEAGTLLDEALTASIAAGDPGLSAEICGALSNVTYWQADLERSRRANADRGLFADRAGDIFARRHVLGWHANVVQTQGDWSGAEAALADAEPIVRRLESREPQAFGNMIRGQIQLWQGNAGTAVDQLAGAIDELRPLGPGTLAWYLGTLGVALIEAGQPDAGRRTLEELDAIVDGIAAGSLPRGSALGQLGYGAVLLEDAGLARRCFDRLLVHRGQLHWYLIDRVLGMLAALLGDASTAAAYLRVAEQQARSAGMRPELVAIHVGQAKLLARGGVSDREEAGRLIASAIEECRALGMKGWQERAEALLSAGAAPQPGNNDGLSGREIEVLKLVVEGLSNRQISERLYLSEKTVANHLTHIFNKIGVDNRSSAVAYALRNRLA